MFSWFALLFALLLPANAQEWRPEPARVDTSVRLEASPPVPTRYLSLPGPYATVHGHPDHLPAMRRLSEHAQRRVPEIALQLGLGTGPAMEITLADTQEAFRQLQPNEPPRWADGTAWPQRALIYLRSPELRPGTASPLEQVLDHEITHVLLGQAFGERPVPRWLQEGLAQWVAGEIGPDLPKRIGQGMLNGGLLSLDELTGPFPSDPQRADLAYAQSADFISWLATEYGPEAIPTLVREMSHGNTVNASLYEATGELAHELDGEWSARLSSSKLWLGGLVNDGALFAIGLPLALIAWARLRARREETFDRWEREDALQAMLLGRLRDRL